MTDYDWSLKLFVSIDIIDSTAFKSRYSLENNGFSWDWSSKFTQFFKDVETEISRQYEGVTSEAVSFEDQLKVWKFLGDEILLETTLKATTQALEHIYAVKNAVMAFNSPDNKALVDLNCKATAWVAGFPLGNTMVKFNDQIDYIGTQIDEGFRIAKESTDRKFTVSLQLAYILGKAIDTSNNEYSSLLKIHYGGQKYFKGLNQGEPLTTFWIDVGIDSCSIEDKWNNLKELDNNEIINYCDNYFERHSWPKKPFIKNDPSYKLGEIPPDLQSAKDKKEKEEKDKYSQGLGDGQEDGVNEVPSNLKQKSNERLKK